MIYTRERGKMIDFGAKIRVKYEFPKFDEILVGRYFFKTDFF